MKNYICNYCGSGAATHKENVNCDQCRTFELKCLKCFAKLTRKNLQKIIKFDCYSDIKCPQCISVSKFVPAACGIFLVK